MSTRTTPSTTVVVFPVEWYRQTFQQAEAAALAADDRREESTMLAAKWVRFIHDTFFKDPKTGKRPIRFKESGYDSFKDWCEARDRSEAWGQYLCKAADHAERVDNPRQARALSGLSEEQADATVAEAKADGEPLTAKRIEEAREKVVAENRAKVKELEDAIHLRRLHRYAEKIEVEARAVDAPEAVFKAIKKIADYARTQLGWEERCKNAA